jgi:hypothetical protein
VVAGTVALGEWNDPAAADTVAPAGSDVRDDCEWAGRKGEVWLAVIDGPTVLQVSMSGISAPFTVVLGDSDTSLPPYVTL